MVEALEAGACDSGNVMDMFNIFETPVKTDIVTEVKPLICYPSAVTRPETRSLTFRLEPVPYFIKLSNTKFQITLQLHKGGADLAAPTAPTEALPAGNPSASFENLTGASIIKSVEIYLNDELVSPASDLYNITSYLILILNYDKVTLDKFWQVSGFNWETNPSSFSATLPDGFRTRLKATNGSEKFFVSCPLFLNLFLSPKLLIPMTSLRLEIQLASPGIAIKSGLNQQGRVGLDYNIFDPRIIFEKIKVTPEFQINFEKRLLAHGGRYDVPNYITRGFVIAAGLNQWTQNDLFSSQFVPNWAYVMLTLQSESIGSTGATIYDFQPHNVKNMIIRASDDVCPPIQSSYDFANRDYFHGFIRLMQENWVQAGNNIDLDAFKTHYALFYFNLNTWQCGERTKRLGTCSLEIEFADNSNAALKCYVFSCSNGVITCDSSRKWQRFF